MWIAGQISFGRANQIQQSKIQSLCPRRNGPVILDSHMLAHGSELRHSSYLAYLMTGLLHPRLDQCSIYMHRTVARFDRVAWKLVSAYPRDLLFSLCLTAMVLSIFFRSKEAYFSRHHWHLPHVGSVCICNSEHGE